MSKRPFNEVYDSNPFGPLPHPDADQVGKDDEGDYSLLGGMDEPVPEAILARMFGDHGHDTGLELDPTLADIPSEGINTAVSNGITDQPTQLQLPDDPDSVPAKRKASSRAGMLARGGACTFCKKRKLKCSAEMPTCSACIRAGKECIYAQTQQKSRVRVLEERLAELERNLGRQDSQDNTPTTTYVPPPMDDHQFERLYGLTSNPPDAGLTLASVTSASASANGSGNGSGKRAEPDLMTLAHAAAADGVEAGSANGNGNGVEVRPWEGMGANQIAMEIIKSVEGAKGVGEAIVAHLLQFYVGPPSIPILHKALPPATFLTRLTTNTTSLPHPALTLSLLPHLLPLSPSASLNTTKACTEITNILLPSARAHSNMATTSADPRILDIIIASNLRSMFCISAARFLEGWAEGSGTAAMAWAAGLGKLGSLAGYQTDVEVEKSRMKEGLLRMCRSKGMIVEPARDRRELGERIDLFWQLFAFDRASSCGWGFPSSFNELEIATPLPRDDYEVNASAQEYTISDFLNGKANSGAQDSVFCTMIKAVTLLNHSNRLFDMPHDTVTTDKIASLVTITESYMQSLKPTNSPESSGDLGQAILSRMILHTALTFFHFRSYIEVKVSHPKGEDKSLQLGCGAMERVAGLIDEAMRYGDQNLNGFDSLAALVWHAAAALGYRFAHKFEHDSSVSRVERDVAEKMRKRADKLLMALQILGKRVEYAKVLSQLLENLSMGIETKLGEWERPTFI